MGGLSLHAAIARGLSLCSSLRYAKDPSAPGVAQGYLIALDRFAPSEVLVAFQRWVAEHPDWPAPSDIADAIPHRADTKAATDRLLRGGYPPNRVQAIALRQLGIRRLSQVRENRDLFERACRVAHHVCTMHPDIIETRRIKLPEGGYRLGMRVRPAIEAQMVQAIREAVGDAPQLEGPGVAGLLGGRRK